MEKQWAKSNQDKSEKESGGGNIEKIMCLNYL